MSTKRDDVLQGVFNIFARDGYAAASVDVIAEQAGVSVRTLYNHFANKEQLFRAVIEQSATRVAEQHIALMDRELLASTDIEVALTRFALAWVDPTPDSADHFRLMRRIQAEKSQLPRAALDAWRRAGPGRVKARLAEHMARFASEGLLRIDDPLRAALQFASLAAQGETWLGGAAHLTPKERQLNAASGVRVFLYGCATGVHARS